MIVLEKFENEAVVLVALIAVEKAKFALVAWKEQASWASVK